MANPSRPTVRIPILCYHKVGPVATEGRSLNIEPDRFASHVRFFKRRGYRFLKVEEWGSATDRCVAFTFDDAYASTLEYAPGILESAGGRGTFYAVPGCTASIWDGDRARPLATFDVLKLAMDRGHEIGNHTLRHPHLNRHSAEEERYEIAEAFAVLARNGIHAATLCYPYGSFDEETVHIAGELGVKTAVTLRKGLAKPTDDPMRLPRITVAFSDTAPMLFYKVFIRNRFRKID